MTAAIPVSRLQYLLAAKGSSVAQRASFVSTQLRSRSTSVVDALTAALDEGGQGKGMNRPAFKPLHEALVDIKNARSGSAAASLAANIWASASPTLEMLQPLFVKAGSSPSSASSSSSQSPSFDAARHRELLDWLQYNLIGLRTLAGSISLAELEAVEKAGSSPSPSPAAVSCDSGFSVAVERVNLLDTVLGACFNVQALAVDKYGVCPPTVFSAGLDHRKPPVDFQSYQNQPAHGSSAPTVVGVRSYLSFAFSELLKNAYGAVIERYGASQVDDAPPVEIRISEGAEGTITVSVADRGGGSRSFAGVRKGHSDFPYFPVPPPSSREPGYSYSRDHGPAMSGKGLGVVRASLYCNYHGGHLCAFSQPEVGYTAMMVLDKTGSAGAGDFLPAGVGVGADETKKKRA